MWRFLLLVILLFFVGVPLAYADHESTKAECPQIRKTPPAPAEFLKMVNPLEVTEKRIKKGKSLYQVKSSPLQCKHCHGGNGDGTGHMGLQANPPARNFSCSETMRNISDGQMFWAIKNGIPGTSMPAYPDLENWKIWVLIHYIRQFSS